jgi:hypothetical protein
VKTKTDAEVVDIVINYMATNRYATQTDLRRVTGSSVERLKKLADAGYYVWPNRIPRNKCHLFSNQEKWRKFRLYGSP